MKFSTRARYGLRMMVELARSLKKEKLVHLGQVARITGLSVNYLAQLAIPLKNNGLLIGVSGKNGGYQLGKPPEQITVKEIIEAVQGTVGLTDCVFNPEVCLNSSFCEARLMWVLASHKLQEVLAQYTLADIIDSDWKEKIQKEFAHIPMVNPDAYLAAKARKGHS